MRHLTVSIHAPPDAYATPIWRCRTWLGPAASLQVQPETPAHFAKFNMSLASESCCHASEYSCRNWSFTSHGRGGPRISPRTARRCASVPRKQNPQPNDQCGQCYGSSDEQQSFLDPELISVYLRRVSGGIKLIHLSLVENARAGGGSIASRSCPFPDWAPPYPVWRI